MPAAGLAGCDALILLVPRFAKESVPADGRLAVVARFGVGYDSVDVPACTEAGIALCITPDGVRRPVAVSILTFILALTQKLLIKDRLCRQGPEGWAKRSDHMGEGLVGKTLGQLGMGNIGAEVFRLAAPFGHARSSPTIPTRTRRSRLSSASSWSAIEELFRRSDFLSVSVPLSEATHHIVGERLLKLMKPTAYVINTARGPVVDQRALHRALIDGTIAGAGLDVFEVEPCPADEPIFRLDNVVVAPHSLCWTDECFAGNGAADIRAALEVMHGRVPAGIVNKDVVNLRRAWRGKLEALAARFGG